MVENKGIFEYYPLWQLTAWDKNFDAVDRNKQSKVIPYHYYLAAELQEVATGSGDVRVISTNGKNSWTTEERAGDTLTEGEIVCIPWGGIPIVQYYKGKFITGDNRIATSLDTHILNNKFLYYAMLADIETISSFYRGSSLKHPNMASVLDLEIPVPPLPEQERIASILGDLDDLIEKQAKIIDKKKRFRDGLREKLYTELECNIDTLANICSVITDGSHSSPAEASTGYLMFSVKDMGDKDFDFRDGKIISPEDYRQLVANGCQPKENDILIAKDGSMLKYVFVIQEERPIVILSSIAILRPKTDRVVPEFIAQYFKQPNLVAAIIAENKSGTGVPRIVLDKFKQIFVPVPQKEIQEQIAAILNDLDEEIIALQISNEKNKHLKAAFLKQLITGNIRTVVK